MRGRTSPFDKEDNVLWGTDSIWYGSPQDQIQALRSFQISEHYQEQYGYAPITPEVRRKIFGLNALKVYPLPAEALGKMRSDDQVSRVRRDYRQLPNPSFRTHGPRTRREFLNLLRWQGGHA